MLDGAAAGNEQTTETFTIQVHEAVDAADPSSAAVVATVQGGVVVGEQGQQIRYEQVVEERPAEEGGGGDGSIPQTVEIVVHPPEEHQQVHQLFCLSFEGSLFH